MPKVLLSVPHQRQQNDGDCLAACAAMVLTHLGRAIDYDQLLHLLDIQSYGAPAGNIRRLVALNLTVTYSQTDLAGLQAMLRQGSPIIVFVQTGELPHWRYNTSHALLVVGYDENNIYVNDPDREKIPLTIPYGDFELAWLERDYYYAMITP